MTRIPALDPTTTTGKTHDMLTAVRGKLGIVPNMMRVLANAPSALAGYLDFSGALATGSLDAKVRELIALTVAEANLCGYCLSAHTFIAGKLGVAGSAISAARQANSENARTKAILELAQRIVVQRGELTDAHVRTARDAGLGDAEIVETIANVALNIFTNYVNHVAGTIVDFPNVAPGTLATAK